MRSGTKTHADYADSADALYVDGYLADEALAGSCR